jgi:hypothetical protein
LGFGARVEARFEFGTLPYGRGSDWSKPETWVTVLTEDMGNS